MKASGSEANTSQTEGSLSNNDSEVKDESWGHRAVILLRDLICLHRLLEQEGSGKETPIFMEAGPLSSRIYNIVDKGPKFNLLGVETKPTTFLRGQKDFLEDTSIFLPANAVYVHSLDFVASAVQDFRQKDQLKKGRVSEDSGNKDAEVNNPKVSSTVTPIGVSPSCQDILLITRGQDYSEVPSRGGQSGNERLHSLVDQYVSTHNENDRVSTLTSEKRAQAAIAILDLALESEGGRKGEDALASKARFLVAPQKEKEELWQEATRVEAAETTLVLLFEKFLDRERAPWGIQARTADGENAKAQQEDFSKPGTIPVAKPASHDVLFGRGGLTNNHPGNRRFRDIISLHRPDYVLAIKIEKPNVAKRIVKAIRTGTPSGRFLKKHTKDDMWYDVGDRQAAEKTSQALREKFRDKQKKKVSMEETSNMGLPQAINYLINKGIQGKERSGAAAGGNAIASPVPVNVPNMAAANAHGMLQPFPGGPQFGPYSMAIRSSEGGKGLPKVAVTAKGKAKAGGLTNQSLSSPAGGEKSGEDDATGAAAKKKKADGSEAEKRASSNATDDDTETDTTCPVDAKGNIVVTDHDILCGRGGLTNHHRGNKRFRDIVSLHRADYVRAPKVLKPNVARLIVRAIRNGDPPGRFLKKDAKSGLWLDIGDRKAAEKASQALREKSSGRNAGENGNDGAPPLSDVQAAANSAILIAPRPTSNLVDGLAPLFAESAASMTTRASKNTNPSAVSKDATAPKQKNSDSTQDKTAKESTSEAPEENETVCV